MGAWQAQCGKLDQYGMQYSRAFANLCNAGVAPATLKAQATRTCCPAIAACLRHAPTCLQQAVPQLPAQLL